jgi:predicted MPP superfamily phosphohydrolase
MIQEYGITVLSNESQYITVNGVRLCLCGIDDPEVFEYTSDKQLLMLKDTDGLLKRFSGLNDDTFNILLAHRPELIENYAKYNFDLVMSGHSHGGQVRIPPFVNGFFAPDQGWFPKYAGGRYKADNVTMVVSRGLGFDERVPRVFNPPDVVVVDIKGE